MGQGPGPDIEAVFDEALKRPRPERAAYLDAACAGDTALLARAHALLVAHQRAEGFMNEGASWEEAAGESADEAAIQEGPGSRIGPYKLLQQIGEGGFGSVFMADQESPVRRRVALKVLKLGMDTRQVIARFEAERQALAMMDHQNIAKVLDAGSTSTGRPYFVMELVKGDPITDYADKNNLAIVDRIGLFIQVCLAVQHAHTKGIIHRDLKPSNVLVSTQDGKPFAKVIDFGIAKATEQRLTEKTLFTEHKAMIGTPEYMSPEQAEGSLDIDTRTDVYSLGVLLYELLTGSTPFDGRKLRSAAYVEIQRIIREVDPPRPSTRFSRSPATAASIAAHRRIEPRKLDTLLRGDLDWVVMKALEKDRARRYETASGLALDLERHLAGRPVVAAPPSVGYLVGKFVRRNKGPVAAAGALLVVLLGGITTTGLALVRAVEAREAEARQRTNAEASQRVAETNAELARTEADRASRAEREAKSRADEAEKSRAVAVRMNKVADAVTEFFTHDLLNLPPAADGIREPTVRDVLEMAPAKIERYFSKEPAIEGVIRERIGQIYFNLGDVKKAGEFLEQALPLLEKGLGPDEPQTMAAEQRLAELSFETGRLERAEELFGKLHEQRLRVLGPDSNFTWNSLMRRGMARAHMGKRAEAVADAEQALAQTRQYRGQTSRSALVFAEQMVEIYRLTGELDKSEALAREMLDLIMANLQQQAPAQPAFRAQLGKTLLAMDRPAEALQELDIALGSYEISFPSGHPELVSVQSFQALATARTGNPGPARTKLEAVYAAYEKTYGPASDQARGAAAHLVEVCEMLSDADGARTWRARAAGEAGAPDL